MAGRVVDEDVVVAERNRARAVVEHVDGRRLLDAKPEQQPCVDGLVVKKQIVAVQIDGHVQRPLRAAPRR